MELILSPVLIISLFCPSFSSIIHIGSCVLMLNEPCSEDYTKFYLYTRKNKETPQFVSFKNSSNLTSSFYSEAAGNKVIIHGYSADMYLTQLINMKNAYLNTSETNVWMVDWAKLSVEPCYPVAIYNTRHVGSCLADFIKKVKMYTFNADFHVIGFSLGAHVPAKTADMLKPFQIPRVTGLDPALPLMMFESKKYQLNSETANFVDVIHTNGLIQGQLKPRGHVDFYINGGLLQPGCSHEKSPLNCDHHRAPEYFAESITSSEGFWGWQCPGYLSIVLHNCHQGGSPVLMGEHVDTTLRGIFAVATRSEKPFAKGKWNQSLNNLTLINNNGPEKLISL